MASAQPTCGGCPVKEVCQTGEEAAVLPMQGGVFGRAAVLCFLLPLVLALLGAALGRGEPVGQLLGGLIGLVLGGWVGKIIVPKCTAGEEL
ncbi:MAG: hypothetical protein GKR89_35710 [Candidatus Latescibacteria bacterium]|nr:hypothetical protein [Candidatus Latescibacterota bacterium]